MLQKETINVYWGQGESETSTRILSNLAPRKFNYKSADGITREYGSVEHAYQSNKSGRFDQDTYNAYNRIQSMEFEGQDTSISIEIKGESGKEFLLTRNRNSAQYVLWSEKKKMEVIQLRLIHLQKLKQKILQSSIYLQRLEKQLTNGLSYIKTLTG